MGRGAPEVGPSLTTQLHYFSQERGIRQPTTETAIRVNPRDRTNQKVQGGLGLGIVDRVTRNVEGGPSSKLSRIGRTILGGGASRNRIQQEKRERLQPRAEAPTVSGSWASARSS